MSQNLLKKKKLNSLLLLVMSIQLSLLSGFQLFAENWISHIVLLKEKLDLDNLFIKRMQLLLPSLKLEKKMKVISTTWQLLSEQTSTRTTSLEKKSEVSEKVQNLKQNSTE